MKKYIKKHLKDEKRILKLMYKKGAFELLHVKLEHIGWEELHQGKRLRRRKGKRKYGGSEWLPEMHAFTVDYWGECDSHSVVFLLKEYFHYINAAEFSDFGYPKDSKFPNNSDLIRELIKMPTIKNDSKFNKRLIVSN